MLELLLAGGWVMWPILMASVVATTIIFERFWVLRPDVIVPTGLTARIRSLHSTDRLDELQLDRIAQASLLGQILTAMFRARALGWQRVEEAAEMTGRQTAHSLERGIGLLGGLASVCPLLGILGTVIGMIKVFGAVTAGGLGQADALAGGIGEALLTTAVGIGVAVPALLCHYFLLHRVRGLVLALEREAGAFSDWMRTESLIVREQSV